MGLVSKKELLSSLHKLMQAITRKEFSELYESNDVEQYNIEQRVRSAHYRLLSLNDSIHYNFPDTPQSLLDEWEHFPEKYGLKPTQSNKIAYGDLVKKTLRYFEYIKSIPQKSSQISTEEQPYNYQSGEPKNVRIISDEQIQTELKRLEPLFQGAVQKLEEAKKKEDKAAIAYWEGVVRDYQNKIILLRGYQDAHQTDIKSEEAWNKRLTDSFTELDKKTSNINYEVRQARIEYYVCISLMIIATFIIIYWYNGFYESLTAKNSNICITTWISYLPYALPVTAYIAFMWILMVQKNRASKISIILSTRLANVHYLEGLMKLINRLSSNTDTAVGRINVIVEKMIDSYLRQLETSEVTEKKIEKIEEKEQKAVPQRKMMNELKRLISHE